MNEIEKYTENIFESIKHIDENGMEFWCARELQKVLDYTEWRKFNITIMKSIDSCINSNCSELEHFVHADKMIEIAKGAKRKITDYKLSRYACYLIAQNGDSRKEVIALAQTYFAIQTRKQELLESEYKLMSEDEKRVYQRNLTRKGNLSLNKTAKNAGVKNFDKFHNAGYRGLYNGETADDIAKRKGLRYREDMLDNMGSEELADNLFRIVQTDSKLKKDKVKGEKNANKTHYEVGKKIRKTIKDLGGTMPENLPTLKRSLKSIKKERELIHETENNPLC